MLCNSRPYLAQWFCLFFRTTKRVQQKCIKIEARTGEFSIKCNNYQGKAAQANVEAFVCVRVRARACVCVGEKSAVLALGFGEE